MRNTVYVDEMVNENNWTFVWPINYAEFRDSVLNIRHCEKFAIQEARCFKEKIKYDTMELKSSGKYMFL